MLKLLIHARWYVHLLLALAAFGLAAFFYTFSQCVEAEKAMARAAGMPAAVSLSSFDPSKDIHPAKEIHVTAWINPDFNYQLTQERRKRSDVVRRMFVLFGPEDAPDSKVARAVILMPETDVERFMETILSNLEGQVGSNPVFALNGTASRSATLDDMADDAMAENGLKKAEGFRYIEIWPMGGREAGLAADPDTGTTIALAIAGFGALMLLISGVKFSRRNALSAPSPAPIAAPGGFAGMGLHGSGATVATAAVVPEAPAPAAKKRGMMPAPHSFAFLGLAVLFGVISTWTGHWQLMALAFGMGVFHFVMRAKVAMDKGVAAVASALTQGKAELSQMRAEDSALAGTGPVVRSQSPVEKLIALGQTTPGKKVAQVAIVVAILFVAPMVLNESLLRQIGTKVFGESSSLASLPEAVQAEIVKSTEPTTMKEISPEPAPAPEPAKTAVLEQKAADPASDSLIPEAASLKPGKGETGAPAPATAAPNVAAEAAAPTDPVIETAAAPVAATEATPEVPAAAAETSEASAETAETAAVAAETAEPAPEVAAPAFLAGFGLGNLAVIAPIIGAVFLAIAAFALMRGRQAKPAAIFAGRDPWSKLAEQARASA